MKTTDGIYQLTVIQHPATDHAAPLSQKDFKRLSNSYHFVSTDKDHCHVIRTIKGLMLSIWSTHIKAVICLMWHKIAKKLTGSTTLNRIESRLLSGVMLLIKALHKQHIAIFCPCEPKEQKRLFMSTIKKTFISESPSGQKPPFLSSFLFVVKRKDCKKKEQNNITAVKRKGIKRTNTI